MAREFCCVDLLGTGVHHARQGALHTNANDLFRFVDSFRAMKHKKILIPMFWGHQMKRGGPIHSDDRATQRALYTAGWVHDICFKPTDRSVLQVVFRAPPGMQVDEETGDLINLEKHTRIREVSAGIGDWRDGTGHLWEDVIVHVALTPLPVWLGQTGVRVYEDCEKLIALSADSQVRVKYVLGDGTMEQDDDPKKKSKASGDPTMPPMPEDEAGEGGEAPEAEAAEGEIPPGDPNAPNETAGAPSADEANPMDESIEGGSEEMPGDELNAEPEPFPLIEDLQEMGIDLPDDTTPENFIDRFAGVIAGLRAAGAVIHVGGEKELGPTSGLKDAKAESAPLFTLSTDEPELRDQNPLMRAALSKVARDARQRRRDRCDAIVAKGLPARIVDQVRERITQVHLSLDGDDISAAMPDADGYLDLLDGIADEIAPLLGVKKTLGDSAATGSPIPNTMPERTHDSNAARRDNYDPEFVQRQVEKTLGAGAKAPTRVGSNA